MNERGPRRDAGALFRKSDVIFPGGRREHTPDRPRFHPAKWGGPANDEKDIILPLNFLVLRWVNLNKSRRKPDGSLTPYEYMVVFRYILDYQVKCNRQIENNSLGAQMPEYLGFIGLCARGFPGGAVRDFSNDRRRVPVQGADNPFECPAQEDAVCFLVSSLWNHLKT